jgi:hypothetical protein
MKTIFFSAVLGFVSLATSCNSGPAPEYIDLTSGKTVRIEKDKETGFMVNAETGKPVYLYVDPAKEDTFYGRTGKKVNKKIIHTEDGVYKFDDEDYFYKNGDYKLKTDDGDIKEKDGDYKKKTGDGDVKIKDGDYKKKTDDGDVKIKNGDTKIKIDDGEVKVKRKD